MKFLYFSKADRQKYIKFCQHIFDKLMKNKKVSTSFKLTLTKNITEKYVEEIYTEGLKPQIVEQGQQICNNLYNIIQKEPNLYKLLRQFQDYDPSAYSHAFLVSMFGNMIIKQFEWESRITSQTVAMACMVHDLGKLQMPKELLTKKVEEMTPEELEEYKKHPQNALEVLQDIPMVKPAVKQIVLQHHEYCDGTGFPNGYNNPKIFTLAKVVCIANDFADIMQEHNEPPVKALKRLLTDRQKLSRYNSNILENFIKVFADPDKVKSENVLFGKK